MSKKLIEWIDDKIESNNKRGYSWQEQGVMKMADICFNEAKILDFIKEDLQRLEAIDNANPSEALECLHKIARKVELADNDDYWEVRNAYAKVEQALLKAQEQELVEQALIYGIWNAVPEQILSVGLVYMLGAFYLTCFDENGRTTGSYPISEYKQTWWLKKDRS